MATDGATFLTTVGGRKSISSRDLVFSYSVFLAGETEEEIFYTICGKLNSESLEINEHEYCLELKT